MLVCCISAHLDFGKMPQAYSCVGCNGCAGLDRFFADDWLSLIRCYWVVRQQGKSLCFVFFLWWVTVYAMESVETSPSCFCKNHFRRNVSLLLWRWLAPPCLRKLSAFSAQMNETWGLYIFPHFTMWIQNAAVIVAWDALGSYNLPSNQEGRWAFL